MNLESFYQSLWFILPLYIANMTPVFLRKINILNYPIDFNITINKKRILGEHKTWRGFIFGSLAGGLTSLLQNRGFLIGLVLGAGGLVGDMLGSFIKRRFNMREGEKLSIIDKTDFIIFSIVFSHILGFWSLDLNQTIFLLIVTPFGSYITDLIGYKLKIKDVPW